MTTKLTYGGWYQRTTLHLSEVYDLFARGHSNLPLSKQKLKDFQKKFGFVSVTRESGYFEYVKAITHKGIEVRYYEDGLYVLEAVADGDVAKTAKALERFYDEAVGPALSYIFSLGAPTPKVLANIKTKHPVVVSVTTESPESYTPDVAEFGEVYGTISSGGVTVSKTPDYIVIAAQESASGIISQLAEMQIFFREFKDQLDKYLQVHRSIWEEISDIKEKKSLRGTQIEAVRSRLDSYQKAVSLISNRINQMGSYARTRSSIAKGSDIEEHLRKLFEFKFETLTDTLDYIKEVWRMTTDYLSSAIQNVVELKNQATARGIQSLQLLTSIGVVSSILGYFSKSEAPKFTALGAAYFAVIILAAWLVNAVISSIYRHKSYTLMISDRAKDL